MLMNKTEFYLMNNPIRGFIQDKLEARRLRKFSDLPAGKTILEIGCGSGRGTKLITQYFKPARVEALDLDPKMIAVAKKTNVNPNVQFQVGDAAKLNFPDSTFGAVVDFGIIHHIPNWRDCLKELHRVVKPGGQLILEDLSIETFSTPFGRLLRKLLAHPYQDMFTQAEFVNELKALGFIVETEKQYYPGLKYFVVIARKPS